MKDTASVAFAVVSWNTRELLARCLDSLAPEVEAGRAEAWVVDNASTDGSAEMVSGGYPWAQLIAQGENLGFGGAVNMVAARTESDWIAPANADTELLPGALDTLLATAERHPEAGVLAPRLVLADGSTQHCVHPFPTLPLTALFNLGAHRVVPVLGDRFCIEGRWNPDRERDVDWALGAFLLVRRRAWKEVGGFAPVQWMYAEDLDLCWRMSRAGWSTRYVPDARVAHVGAAATSQAWGEARRGRWVQSSYAWMERRRGARVTRAYALLNLTGAAVRWAALRALAVLRPARFAAPCAEMAEWARLHRTALGSVRDPSR